MNKIKDKTMKDFLENNAYFVDFFNAYFFDGKKVLKPENCVELDSEMNDSHMDLEKHVDVIRKYNDGNLYSAFIIENQSRVDASMVVRAATYEYVAYERMLKKLKKNRKNEKLPMVHILVFYTGERPWSAASKLSELVEVDERFKAYFHEYKMNLIEITGNTSYNFNEEDVYNLFYICRSIYDQSIYEPGKSNSFGLVKSSVLKVVKTLTDVEWLDLKELEEKEEIAMCEAEKRWLEVKSKEWEAEGIRKGIKQGIEQGIEQGVELGQVLLYKTMIKNGMSVNEISKVCSISVESLKRVLSN
ncbi:Rpn family recombination-promoting nuclease/putative transposase [uncultured Holdemanella sp.]|uniref:Rpn family recombination-promoting nuclease/putative transposase n=1 Tax=uncultured Holdemanella sp. TaxID=1763549 RepID=UPI0025DE132D|nr:Rpn family recombination-promoting nuclease/putative transposase [uncultured Holdemanella sp.]